MWTEERACKEISYEDPHNLISLPEIIKVIRNTRFMWRVERIREMRSAYRSMVRKPEEKRPFRTPKSR
jgi:hypothetical protein